MRRQQLDARAQARAEAEAAAQVCVLADSDSGLALSWGACIAQAEKEARLAAERETARKLMARMQASTLTYRHALLLSIDIFGRRR